MANINDKVDEWSFEAQAHFRPGIDSGLEPIEMNYTVPASGLQESKGNAFEAFREHLKKDRGYTGAVKSEQYDKGLREAAVEFEDGSYLTLSVRSQI